MKQGNCVLWICRVMLCLMAAVTLAGFILVPSAQAEEVQVTIKSFMRAASEDGTIRNSELMEAVLTGYEGNPYELTYEWKNVNCNANLYIYNSYNMDGIDNTPGEIEKIGKNQSRSGKGFAWAAVRSKEASNYNGQIQVTVKDANGNVLAIDTYTDFLAPKLVDDLAGIAFGMFIDETVNVKDLLGRSAIVHITCAGTSVSNGQIEDNQNIASLKKENYSGNYYVTGQNKGQTSATITVSKGPCSFHTNQRATVTTPIYVFQKPQTSTTTTTLTLTELDDRCEYFIGSVKGEKEGDKVVFTGLTPNTEYQVTVRGKYEDTDGTVKYAYAYVKDTTKPVYTATVNLYLDDVRMDAADILGAGTELYLYDESKPSVGYLPMTETATGVYTAGVENGSYHVYRTGDANYQLMSNAVLTIRNANREMDLRYYTVQYDCNGGSFADGKETITYIYSAGSAVSAVTQVPQREGYSFTGWQYDGKTYQPGNAITSSISSAVVLLAQWEKSVNVTINVTIDHRGGGDGYDTAADKDEVSVYLLEKKTSDPAYLETSDELHFTHEQVSNEDGDPKAYLYSSEYIVGEPQNLTHASVSAYTATDATYTNMSGSSAFDVKVHKSRYDVEAVTKTRDDSGNWEINVRLKFNPSNFDLEYTVQMHEDVPKELYPSAVVYKVAFWAGEERGWEIITQMEGDKGGERVQIDPVTGKGRGSYPVWKYDSDNATPYGYRIVLTGFVYDEHTITVPSQAGVAKQYSDGNYTAVMNDVNDGRQYGQGFYGAYLDGEDQKGTLDAVISLEAHDVTFNAMGGKVNDQSEQTVKNQYYIPAFSDYLPIRDDHQFLGWYKDAAYTKPASENELLTSDVTLYARWDRILTCNVMVEGTYQQGGEIIAVWERDRAMSVNVLLQEMIGSNPQTIESQTVDVTWLDNTGTTEAYTFTGLSPEKTYRVAFEVVNYTAKYQNENTASNTYNDDDYIAVYKSKPDETFVNGLMSFTPASYHQPVTVDATRIGEGFRPENVLVEIHYRRTGSGDPMQVISQHTADPYGIPMQMVAATGRPDRTYTQSVWKEFWDGTLYDYQAKVTKIDNEDLSALPLTVRYGDVSRWSPASGQPTATLEAILVPNFYPIVYHLGDGSEDVQDERSHTWSFETQINYTPKREGYIFAGWYNNADCSGEPVTKIEASHAAPTDLYAKWTPRSDLSLTVHYKDKDDDSVIHASNTQTDMTLGTVVSIDELKVDIAGYEYNSANPAEVTIQPDNNVLTLYYAKKDIDYTVKYFYDDVEDASLAVTAQAKYKSVITTYTKQMKQGYALDRVENLPMEIDADPSKNIINVYYATDVLNDRDDSETGGDGIPDKYQKKIVFKVVGGTWANGTAADIIEVVTLMKDNEWSTEGEASLDVPVGMKPNKDFKDGAWDTDYLNGEGVTTLTVKGSDPAEQVFTHAFKRSIIDFDVVAAYQVVHWLQQTDGTYAEANREFPLFATVDTEVTATAKDYGEHYALKGELPKGIVTDPRPQIPGAEPNLLTLNVYYDLDRHTVTYDFNGGTGAAGIDYSEQTYTCGTSEQVKAVPMNHGHLFKGWKDQNGNVYQAGASFVVNQNYVFTAVWEKQTGLSYTVNYLDEDSGSVIRPSKTESGKTYQDSVLSQNEVIPIDKYCFVRADKTELIIDAFISNNVINLYYARDVLHDGNETDDPDDSDNETDGDGIPDKYQKKIVFKVVGGTWADGTTNDILEIVTLKKNGQWDKNGTASLTVPVGMKANEHFRQDSGAWDKGVPSTVSGTADETYTFTFQHSTKPIEPSDTVKYIVEHYKADINDAYPTDPTEVEILAGTIGTTVTAEPKTYEGYCLNTQVSIQSGTLVTLKMDSDIVVLKLFYNKDVEYPDGIPDKYQKMVIFKVVNGTWADDTTDDIIEIVTLMKDGKWDENGTASLTVPVGMKAFANFTDGQWDTTPPAVVSGLNDEVYTFYMPNYVLPQTGDTTNLALLMTLMGTSSLLFALCVSKRKART